MLKIEERQKINNEIGKERNAVLPSTLYPSNILTVEHLDTGITLTFSCMDALRCQDTGYMGTITTNKETFRKLLSQRSYGKKRGGGWSWGLGLGVAFLASLGTLKTLFSPVVLLISIFYYLLHFGYRFFTKVDIKISRKL